MNDPTPTDDELASAYLDGEATADEIARVEADPALLARVEEFRGLSSDVGRAPVIVDADRDRMLAIAVAASSPTVSHLSSARRRRVRWQPVAAAAAVLVAVALVAPRLGGDGADELVATDDSADSGEDGDLATFDAEMAPADGVEEARSSDDGDDAADDAAAAGSMDDLTAEADDDGDFDDSGGEGDATELFDPVADELGEFESLATLVDEFDAGTLPGPQTQLDADDTSEPTAPADDPRCEDERRSIAADGATDTARVVIDGRDGLLVVLERPDGFELWFIDGATCAVEVAATSSAG